MVYGDISLLLLVTLDEAVLPNSHFLSILLKCLVNVRVPKCPLGVHFFLAFALFQISLARAPLRVSPSLESKAGTAIIVSYHTNWNQGLGSYICNVELLYIFIIFIITFIGEKRAPLHLADLSFVIVTSQVQGEPSVSGARFC